ncbi:MAG: hypothetical protein A2710_10730 [Burkholderiales bacterium RIFCSPHIGHO2_01_FULL_64_960]|nr:MAG: hypothetical protein A2710_10730 [Burkholderiales bacterium RIFCSPHIGHO2_01_FULL_64_960]
MALNGISSQKGRRYATRKFSVDKVFLMVDQARNGFSPVSAAFRQQFVDQRVIALVNDGPDFTIRRYRHKSLAVWLVLQVANKVSCGSEGESARSLVIDDDILRAAANNFRTAKFQINN